MHRLALPRAPGYTSAVAKRMSLCFGQTGFPAYQEVPENGKPVPCALGQPWVNLDTQLTLRRLRIPLTDPWGKPLPGEPDDPKVPARR